jgi:hypothetical protein
MSPNVHLLDRRESQTETQRPNRTEVEAAVRTIIRWTGEDPDRDGLIETPARVTRSFEEFFSGYGQDPAEILEKTFEEIEGYDGMIVGLGRLHSKWPRGRHFQAGSSSRRLCQAPANSRDDDSADRQHNQ